MPIVVIRHGTNPRKSTTRSLSGLFLLACCMLSGVFGQNGMADDVAAENGITLDTILAAWDARQERIQSMDFTIIADTGLMREVPPKHREYRLFVDGEHYRFEKREEALHESVEGLEVDHHVEIFDGERKIGVVVCEHDVYVNPWYTSAAHERCRCVGLDPEAWPIFHTFRIQQHNFLPVGAECWSLSGRTGVVDGQTCIVLYCRAREYGSDVLYEVWVDPARDYIAVRREHKYNGMITQRLDIDYEFDSEAGWVPTNWISAHFVEGTNGLPELHSTSMFAVAERTLNQPMDEDLFSLENEVVVQLPIISTSVIPTEPSTTWRWIVAAILLAALVAWPFARRRTTVSA